MDNHTKILKQASDAVKKAVEQARMKRNEENRKYILAALGKDLIYLLEPFLYKLAENSRMSREDFKKILTEIKIEAPQVNISPPNIEVKSPDIPVISFPEKAMIKAIRQAFAGIVLKAPDVSVNTPEMKIPKEMEVKGLKGFLNEFKNFIQKPAGNKRSDKPMKIVLIDPKTGKEYKASAGAMPGGGGGKQILATGSVINEVSLAAATTWYSFDIPDNTIMLDMFLTARGYQWYYKWDLNGERIPVFSGYTRHISNIMFNKRVIYFTCPTANQTIVIEAFVGS